MAAVPLIEDEIIHDVFVSGIGRIEKLSGGLVRITWYKEELTDDGRMVHKVVAKIIRPIATWHEAMKMLARAMSEDGPLIAEDGDVRPVN